MKRKFEEGHDDNGEVGLFYDVVPTIEESSVGKDEDALHFWREDILKDNDATVLLLEGTETTKRMPQSNEETCNNNCVALTMSTLEDMEK